LVAHPGMVLFTPKPSISEQVDDMVESIASLWPIFFINGALIAMAGIVFAALTFDEIPESNACTFVSGSFRGMYWAFITMFTHGYGDITPSTIISRIFAVIWIFIGLVISAILVGGITTALTVASVLPEASLYGTELAAIQGSKEYVVGIYRNAKVNSKQNYSTTDDVYRALKKREVQAALVDAFIAASRSDLFSDDEIIARKMLQYSYTYGLVISGEMKNAHTNIANYISNNRQQISQLIENTTPKFSINYAAKEATPLFDPSSPFLRKSLIGLFVVFIVLFIVGSTFHFYRKKFRRNVKIQPAEFVRVTECEMICKEFFEQVEEFYTGIEGKSEGNLKTLVNLKRSNTCSRFKHNITFVRKAQSEE